MAQPLAIKYRPQDWDDLCEQLSIKTILTQQVETGTFSHVYLFCGGAGTGKTTSARILAYKINKGHGSPIEMDAASNSSVDNVRDIIQQARTKALDSEYKVFIIDECHALSNAAWQAFLKIMEETPEKVIFIFCTTDPQKIPKTILSRVQRYNFQRISYEGICSRLLQILKWENVEYDITSGAVEYISRLSDGGMRDAITLLDKCLAYSPNLTMENVTQALGVTGYDDMFDLLYAMEIKDPSKVIKSIESIHMSGVDLKYYMKQFTNFVLDVCKFQILNNFEYIHIPSTYSERLKAIRWDVTSLLNVLVTLQDELRWETSPKSLIESTLLLFVCEK